MILCLIIDFTRISAACLARFTGFLHSPACAKHYKDLEAGQFQPLDLTVQNRKDLEILSHVSRAVVPTITTVAESKLNGK